MKNLKNMAAAIGLTFLLGLPVFGGQSDTPPVAPPPPAPGVTQGPGMPSIAPGDMGTSTLATSRTSFTELAAFVLESILPLF